MFAPYLFFCGDCREAMETYAAIFGGEVQFTRYVDMPRGEGGEDYRGSERILHASLHLPDGRVLLGSDYPPGMDDGTIGRVSVLLEQEGADRAKALFEALAEVGRVTWPWAPSFWSEGFGMIEDRFGVPWIVNAIGSDASGGSEYVHAAG